MYVSREGSLEFVCSYKMYAETSEQGYLCVCFLCIFVNKKTEYSLSVSFRLFK